MYARFNREGHPRNGEVMLMGVATADVNGDVYFYSQTAPGEESENYSPSEFSDWFQVDSQGQKVYLQS